MNRRAKAARRAVRAYQAALMCGHCTGRYRGNGPHGPGVYHDPGCPVLAGAVDPGADARRAAAAASGQAGIPVDGSSAHYAEGGSAGFIPSQPAGSRTAELVEQFLRRMRRADMEFCRHCGPDSLPVEEGRLQWAAWDSGRLMCEACFTAPQQRAGQARGEITCDYCHQRVPVPQDPREPRLYVTVVGLSLVTLHVGLCRACHAADQAGSAA